MEFIENYSITIEDLARKHGKGHQAIRNYIDRYEELKGHYERRNGSTWLDAFAVSFIEGKIKPIKPDVAVFNAVLEEKIRELQDKLIQSHERNERLMDEKETLRIEIIERQRLIESHQNKQKQIQDELTATVNQNELLQKELQREAEEKKKAWKVKDEFEAELEKVAELNVALQTQTEKQAAEIERLRRRTLWERIKNK